MQAILAPGIGLEPGGAEVTLTMPNQNAGHPISYCPVLSTVLGPVKSFVKMLPIDPQVDPDTEAAVFSVTLDQPTRTRDLLATLLGTDQVYQRINLGNLARLAPTLSRVMYLLHHSFDYTLLKTQVRIVSGWDDVKEADVNEAEFQDASLTQAIIVCAALEKKHKDLGYDGLNKMEKALFDKLSYSTISVAEAILEIAHKKGGFVAWPVGSGCVQGWALASYQNEKSGIRNTVRRLGR